MVDQVHKAATATAVGLQRRFINKQQLMEEGGDFPDLFGRLWRSLD